MIAGNIFERSSERRSLLRQIHSDPNRDWTRERRRLADLQRTLAFHDIVHP